VIVALTAVVVGAVGAALIRLLAVSLAPGPVTVTILRSVIDAVLLGAATAVAFNHAPSIAAGMAGVVALAATMIATHIDQVYRVIPNRLTYRLPFVLAALTAFGMALDGTADGVLLAGGLAVLAPVVLYSISAVYARYTGQNGFGMGDLKLVPSLTFAAALWGSVAVAAYAYATFLTAAFVSSVLLVTGRANRSSKLAFAPFFLVGMSVAVIAWPLL